jgi:predicted transcriptional regulator
VASSDLPKPDSAELKKLLPTTLHQTIYEALYELRKTPPTMKEVQEFVRAKLGDDAADQTHFSKRVRELRDHFDIPNPKPSEGYRYEMRGRLAQSKADVKIDKKTRAAVLKFKRCEMCGRTPAEDGVRLHVDHKIPRQWGGKTELENLQALCSECNEGKKAFFATFDEHADKLAAAVSHDEPHRRIGELLKAFAPDEIRSDVIELAASAKQYQEDWHKRMRELRELGWEYEARKQKDERGRIRSYYRLTKWEPWPDGNIAAEIKQREAAKKAAKKKGG